MNQNFYSIPNDNFNKYSDNIFIEEESGEKWKYNDIKKLTSQFSTFLKNLSLKKGSRIIVQAEKNVHSVALYLSCLKKGIIYIPLNTAYTSNEMSYFINNVEPQLIFLSNNKFDEHEDLLLDFPNIKTFILDTENTELTDEVSELLEDNNIEELDENDIASIIFTSGTTGKSKGAMITHRNLESNGNALVLSLIHI